MEYSIRIPGEPVPKERPRFARRTGHAYTPEKTKQAEKEIAYMWKLEHPGVKLKGPLFLEMVFNLKPPKGPHGPYPTKRPDIDNLEKLITDALNGVAYEDDKQIVQVKKIKRWADLFNGQPGTILWIREAE